MRISYGIGPLRLHLLSAIRSTKTGQVIDIHANLDAILKCLEEERYNTSMCQQNEYFSQKYALHVLLILTCFALNISQTQTFVAQLPSILESSVYVLILCTFKLCYKICWSCSTADVNARNELKLGFQFLEKNISTSSFNEIHKKA